MHSNVWYDKNLCGTNLCDLCLTHIIRINISHTEICRFRVVQGLVLYYSMICTYCNVVTASLPSYLNFFFFLNARAREWGHHSVYKIVHITNVHAPTSTYTSDWSLCGQFCRLLVHHEHCLPPWLEKVLLGYLCQKFMHTLTRVAISLGHQHSVVCACVRERERERERGERRGVLYHVSLTKGYGYTMYKHVRCNYYIKPWINMHDERHKAVYLR